MLPLHDMAADRSSHTGSADEGEPARTRGRSTSSSFLLSAIFSTRHHEASLTLETRGRSRGAAGSGGEDPQRWGDSEVWDDNTSCENAGDGQASWLASLCTRRQSTSQAGWRPSSRFGFGSDRNAWIQLGYTACVEGREDEAREHFERAILLDPSGVPGAIAHLNLARLAESDDDRAYASLERALELQPQYSEAHYEMGRLLYRQHRPHESVESFRSALAFIHATPQPPDPDLFRSKVSAFLTLALIEEGRNSEAKGLEREIRRETEVAMAMHPIGLAFCSEPMEHAFAARRSARAAWTTRSLLLLGILQMTVSLGFIVSGPRDEQSHLYVALYSGGAVSCLLNLLATLHRRFWLCKSLSISLSIILVMGIQLANLLFLLTDSVKSFRDESTIEMDKELVQAIMAQHLQFALLFACPQLFGLRWITMAGIVAFFFAAFLPMWLLLPSAHVFFPPAYIVTILMLVVVVSRTVEKQERLWFRATRLLAAESEAMAQYESFWRTADADRHASDLQVAKARTALDIRNQTTAFLFHEIRNPLHALHGAVAMLGNDNCSRDKRQRYSKIARSSMGMVRNVLDDVLLLSKIEEGKVSVHKEPFDIEPWLEELQLMFSGQADEKALKLTSRVQGFDARLHVRGDRNRLAEVVANLLGNALKFTSTGSVELAVVQQAATATACSFEVSVTDTGPGLSAEQIDSLFEPYTSLSDSSTAQAGARKGIGLGLVISKQLVKAHGGEIFVKSAGVGTGSCFGFRITLETQPASPDHCSSFFTDGKVFTPESRTNRFNLGETQTQTPVQKQDVTQRKECNRRVLVVDDDELNRCITAEMLSAVEGTDNDGRQQFKFEIDTATDGVHALEMLSGSSQYDIVVTDVIMPRLDGRGLCRTMHETSRCMPVVGLTGCASAADMRSCLEAGMVACLAKPVDLHTLTCTVTEAILAAEKGEV